MNSKVSLKEQCKIVHSFLRNNLVLNCISETCFAIILEEEKQKREKEEKQRREQEEEERRQREQEIRLAEEERKRRETEKRLQMQEAWEREQQELKKLESKREPSTSDSRTSGSTQVSYNHV